MGGWKMYQMFVPDCNFDDPVFEEGIRWQCAASPEQVSQLEGLFTTGSGSCEIGFLDLLKEVNAWLCHGESFCCQPVS